VVRPAAGRRRARGDGRRAVPGQRRADGVRDTRGAPRRPGRRGRRGGERGQDVRVRRAAGRPCETGAAGRTAVPGGRRRDDRVRRAARDRRPRRRAHRADDGRPHHRGRTGGAGARLERRRRRRVGRTAGVAGKWPEGRAVSGARRVPSPADGRRPAAAAAVHEHRLRDRRPTDRLARPQERLRHVRGAATDRRRSGTVRGQSVGHGRRNARADHGRDHREEMSGRRTRCGRHVVTV